MIGTVGAGARLEIRNARAVVVAARGAARVGRAYRACAVVGEIRTAGGLFLVVVAAHALRGAFGDLKETVGAGTVFAALREVAGAVVGAFGSAQRHG